MFLRNDKEYQEWQVRIRNLEEYSNELRGTKIRLEGRVEELEQIISVECANAKNLSDALERETEARIQAEKQLILSQQRQSGPLIIFIHISSFISIPCHIYLIFFLFRRRTNRDI